MVTTSTFLGPYQADCPARRLLDRVGDRWTVLIIGVLADGDTRFADLSRRIDGISRKMLTQTLRGLERDGLVLRTVHPTVPIRVEYSLTGVGRTLLEPLAALVNWSTANVDAVADAQAAYDATR